MATYPGAEVIPYTPPGGVSAIVRDGRLDQAQKDLIRKRICREATDLDLTEFFWTCEKYGLNPFGRAQIWAYPRGGKVVIQVGINGDRLIAARSGEYEGQTEPEWCGDDGLWRGFWNFEQPPAAARVGVWRRGARAPTYAVANYREFVQRGRDGKPIAQWAERPAHMLAKVAESHALRKCFQAEFAELSASFEPTLGEARARASDLYDAGTADQLAQPRRAAPPLPLWDAIPRTETAAPVDINGPRKAFFAAARERGLEVKGDAEATRRQIHAALGLPDDAGRLKAWAERHGWEAAKALLEAGETIQQFHERQRAAATPADEELPRFPEHDPEEPPPYDDTDAPAQPGFDLDAARAVTDVVDQRRGRR